MSRRFKIIRNEILVVLYVFAFFAVAVSVGKTSKITSYNIAGVNSLKSSHLLTEYVPPKDKEIIEKPTNYKYRLTSYYTGDECNSGACTGSGWCTDKFQKNEKGWYTYKGKLVLAAATTYLQNKFGYKENKLYFKYYDEVILTIDGKEYQGIILDTCGACYKSEKIDLFVSGASSVIDRGYQGYNMITIKKVK